MPRYNLSAGEQTDAGRFLYHVYYRTNLLDMFTREEQSGCPHNGGSHTLFLNVSKEDLLAFFDLITETFGQREDLLGARANVFVSYSLERCGLTAERAPVDSLH
jgi:hypothetical protein